MFSADELLVTELLLNGVFNNLSPQQSAALLSCMVFQENASELPKLTEELSVPLRMMQVSPFPTSVPVRPFNGSY